MLLTPRLPHLGIGFLAATLLLAACGGGGSGGSNNPAATLEVSPLVVDVSADITQPAPFASVQASVQASSSTQFYIAVSITHSGAESVSLNAEGTLADIQLTFKSPAALGVGTYTDTLTVHGCYDQGCTQEVTGSPTKVTITYTVGLPIPQIYDLTPAFITAGAPAFVLAVSGNNFQSSSSVLWNGSPRPTTLVNGVLQAQISATDVAASGTVNVQVANGASVSAGIGFTISPTPPLAFDQVSPHQLTAGTGPFYVSAVGNGFTAASVVTWNGVNLPTTYVSATLVRGMVTAGLLTSVGTAAVAVIDSPGGATGTKTVNVVAPSLDAVSYQMNPAHTGSVVFQNATLPAASAWSVDVGGTPSYALIVGGNVFVTVAINGNSQLVALNGATGAILWGPIALTGSVNVTYDGGSLFAVSGSPEGQIITALDPATGNQKWSATVPGGWFPEPPVAADGIVYAINAGEVTAFDESNGATLWSGNVGGTSGVVAVTPDGVYGSSPCTATNLLPATGTVLWTHNTGCEGGGGATPVVANGVLYSPDGSSYSSGTVFDAESGAVKGNYAANVIPAFTADTGFIMTNGTLQGLARSNNQVLWSFAGDGQLSTAAIVVGHFVFVGSTGGNLYALDSLTGAQLWTMNLGAAIPSTYEGSLGMYSGLAAGDGLLVVPSGTKVTAYLLSASP